MNDLLLHGRATISGGVLLIGLGILLLTAWWWQGIGLVISAASELLLRGHVPPMLGTLMLSINILQIMPS